MTKMNQKADTPDIIDLMTAEQDAWISKLLPNRDVRKTLIKLTTEVAELLEAIVINGSKDDMEKEAGDVIILYLDVCLLKGIDPKSAFRRAMDQNYGRSWVTKNGSLIHTNKED